MASHYLVASLNSSNSRKIFLFFLVPFLMSAAVRTVSGQFIACPNWGNTVRCSGYLQQEPNGCMLLVVPAVTWVNDPANVVTAGLQYYTLHDLPASYPPPGAWVTVTGQLYQGYNTAPNGEACPGNYINVTSIS